MSFSRLEEEKALSDHPEVPDFILGGKTRAVVDCGKYCHQYVHGSVLFVCVFTIPSDGESRWWVG
jgi:hypothetical protein